ncbi:hypothetical protein PtrM4_062610 [Pyrenophora tritici-repentis]|uniref:Uncharacterized protein n=1 Tax=Pyrenophora tritici-repentis TaxID=45151 RepID=A0A834S6Z2_9PLEO|nr:hypothetical protein PtrM4_062610 [Pyrenophora tritici-repentis]
MAHGLVDLVVLASGSINQLVQDNNQQLYYHNHNYNQELGLDSLFHSSTQLTEENLRSHSSIHSKADSACHLEDQQSAAGYTELYYRYDGDFAESDDGDADAQRQTMALRRAASLEVLKAYGGCFASGFLALQEPLPTRAKSKLRIYESADGCEMQRTASIATSFATSSSSWGNNDNPRPDSATLSSTPVPESAKGARWRWRSMKKSWKPSAKKVEV